LDTDSSLPNHESVEKGLKHLDGGSNWEWSKALGKGITWST